mmetsp:Transcript_20912/g.53950  ORF Transcript_20912/g.53950 Transcript_20912/m.53950 type:complete len:82 (+) Transcript_20912:535-780(+)
MCGGRGMAGWAQLDTYDSRELWSKERCGYDDASVSGAHIDQNAPAKWQRFTCISSICGEKCRLNLPQQARAVGMRNISKDA